MCFLRIFFLLALSILIGDSASAQTCSNPPTSKPSACQIPPASGYGFGEAQEHSHTVSHSTLTGFYCGRGLVDDPANTTTHTFTGNTVCVNHWEAGPQWYWYDWATDPLGLEKAEAWGLAYPYQWVTIEYDPICGLAFAAYDPWQ